MHLHTCIKRVCMQSHKHTHTSHIYAHAHVPVTVYVHSDAHRDTLIALNKCPPPGGGLLWKLIQVRMMRAGHLLPLRPRVPPLISHGQTTSCIYTAGKRGRAACRNALQMIFFFLGFCLWIIKINRRGKTVELWWQRHTDAPQLPVGGASREHSCLPVSLAWAISSPFRICADGDVCPVKLK